MSGLTDYIASEKDAQLPPGEWVVNRRGIRVFRPRRGRPPMGDDGWTYEQLCAAHRRYASGDRDEHTREGERVYHRMAKRRQRAAHKAMGRKAA